MGVHNTEMTGNEMVDDLVKHADPKQMTLVPRSGVENVRGRICSKADI